jgi:hypothetical protein
MALFAQKFDRDPLLLPFAVYLTSVYATSLVALLEISELNGTSKYLYDSRYGHRRDKELPMMGQIARHDR